MSDINLAVLTTTVCALGWEVAKGAASEAGKTAWDKLKLLLPLGGERIDPRWVADRLNSDEAVRAEVQRLLAQLNPEDLTTTVSINVTDFVAEKNFTAHTQHIGDVH
jgi:hypothetical protein